MEPSRELTTESSCVSFGAGDVFHRQLWKQLAFGSQLSSVDR